MEGDTHDRQTNLTQIAVAQYTAEWKYVHCYKPTGDLMTGLNEQQWDVLGDRGNSLR